MIFQARVSALGNGIMVENLTISCSLNPSVVINPVTLKFLAFHINALVSKAGPTISWASAKRNYFLVFVSACVVRIIIKFCSRVVGFGVTVPFVIGCKLAIGVLGINVRGRVTVAVLHDTGVDVTNAVVIDGCFLQNLILEILLTT